MRFLLLVAALACSACTARNYTHYLIRPAPQKNPALVEEGTLVRPMAFGSCTVMKVTWNDGEVMTQVHIPMLASGQRIVIEHGQTPEQVQTLPSTRIVPPRPSLADKSLVEAYRSKGLRVNEDAPDISVTKARTEMESSIRTGNYQMALEWCEMVLSRYPSQPGFLRAKGSILLLMGEREKAIEIYEAAEEIESDPQVRKTLEELQKEGR